MKSIYPIIVYIVKCNDGSYYTGVTNDLDRRLAEHNEGINPDAYIHSRRPVELVFALGFQNNLEAFAFEKQIKGWSRKKKEALMAWDWDKIQELAKCRNETSHLFYRKKNDISS